MGSLCRRLSSPIGKKVQVAAAGLLLCGFLVAHLAGNLLLFVGAPAFNEYAEKLEHLPILPLAEIGLAAIFLLHIVAALWTRYENFSARPVRYAETENAGGRTVGSSTMLFSGLLVLAFLIVHLKTFRFSEHPGTLYDHVMGWFSNRLYSGFYVVAMGALLLHLSHGFQSALRTFGVEHPRVSPWLVRLGWLFAVAMSAGFASIPIWAGFMRGY